MGLMVVTKPVVVSALLTAMAVGLMVVTKQVVLAALLTAMAVGEVSVVQVTKRKRHQSADLAVRSQSAQDQNCALLNPHDPACTPDQVTGVSISIPTFSGGDHLPFTGAWTWGGLQALA